MEDKKLILEFMGYKIDGNIVVSAPIEDSFDSYDLLIGYNIALADYDSSWNALMPVVEKCTQIWNKFEFDTQERNMMEDEIWNLDGILSDFLNADIGAIYRRIVKFIKWFNQKNMKIINVADLTNPETGKTYREENSEKQHKYKLGDLVEIIGWDEDCEFDGMRLYIIGLVRDCDSTPLYVLGSKGMELYQKGFGLKENVCYNFNSFSGFSERSLKLIRSA